jgi:hypothetical protein
MVMGYTGRNRAAYDATAPRRRKAQVEQIGVSHCTDHGPIDVGDQNGPLKIELAERLHSARRRPLQARRADKSKQFEAMLSILKTASRPFSDATLPQLPNVCTKRTNWEHAGGDPTVDHLWDQTSQSKQLTNLGS